MQSAVSVWWLADNAKFQLFQYGDWLTMQSSSCFSVVTGWPCKVLAVSVWWLADHAKFQLFQYGDSLTMQSSSCFSTVTRWQCTVLTVYANIKCCFRTVVWKIAGLQMSAWKKWMYTKGTTQGQLLSSCPWYDPNQPVFCVQCHVWRQLFERNPIVSWFYSRALGLILFKITIIHSEANM